MTDRPKPHWLVGHVQTGAEKPVRDRLTEDHGCEVYLPVVGRTIRRAGNRRPETMEIPLFPSYLFVDTLAGDPGGARDDPRFRYWLGLVDEDEMAKVRAIEGEGVMEPQGEPLVVFVVGDRVKVLGGAAGGCHSWVEAVHGGSLVLLGEDFPAPVTVTDLTNVERCAR